MTTQEPSLSADRLVRRREHLMREITLAQARPASSSVPARPVRSWQGWRGRALVGAVTTTCAVVAVTLVVTLSGPAGNAPAAFAFQRVSQTTVAVRIVDSTVDAGEMTAQLHKQGINVTVDAVPVSPQVVGTWVSVSFSADVPASVRDAVREQVPNGYTATVDLPTSFKGAIRFGVGRDTESGEDPQVVAQRNALAPGPSWVPACHRRRSAGSGPVGEEAGLRE
jgi:hypothetical protein